MNWKGEMREPQFWGSLPRYGAGKYSVAQTHECVLRGKTLCTCYLALSRYLIPPQMMQWEESNRFVAVVGAAVWAPGELDSCHFTYAKRACSAFKTENGKKKTVYVEQLGFMALEVCNHFIG